MSSYPQRTLMRRKAEIKKQMEAFPCKGNPHYKEMEKMLKEIEIALRALSNVFTSK